MWFAFLFACNNADVGPSVQKDPENIEQPGLENQEPPAKPEPASQEIPTYSSDELITLSGTVEYSGAVNGNHFHGGSAKRP